MRRSMTDEKHPLTEGNPADTELAWGGNIRKHRWLSPIVATAVLVTLVTASCERRAVDANPAPAASSAGQR